MFGEHKKENQLVMHRLFAPRHKQSGHHGTGSFDISMALDRLAMATIKTLRSTINLQIRSMVIPEYTTDIRLCPDADTGLWDSVLLIYFG